MCVWTLSFPSPRVIASTPVKASSALPEDFWNINGGEEETSKTSGTEDDEFGLDEAIQRSKEPVKVPGKVDSDTAPKEQRHRKKTDQSDEAMEGVEPQEAAPQPIPPDIMRKTVLCLEELKKCLEQAPHTIVSGILWYTVVDWPCSLTLSSLLPPFLLLPFSSSPPLLPFLFLPLPSSPLPTQVQAPLKSFPTKVKCFPDTEEDYFPALVRMFQARRLLECLLVLVSASSTNLEISVFAGVRGLLLHFMSSQQGGGKRKEGREGPKEGEGRREREGGREGEREGRREECKLKGGIFIAPWLYNKVIMFG